MITLRATRLFIVCLFYYSHSQCTASICKISSITTSQPTLATRPCSPAPSPRCAGGHLAGLDELLRINIRVVKSGEMQGATERGPETYSCTARTGVTEQRRRLPLFTAHQPIRQSPSSLIPNPPAPSPQSPVPRAARQTRIKKYSARSKVPSSRP